MEDDRTKLIKRRKQILGENYYILKKEITDEDKKRKLKRLNNALAHNVKHLDEIKELEKRFMWGKTELMGSYIINQLAHIDESMDATLIGIEASLRSLKCQLRFKIYKITEEMLNIRRGDEDDV